MGLGIAQSLNDRIHRQEAAGVGVAPAGAEVVESRLRLLAVAHVRLPIVHRKLIGTINRLERLIDEEHGGSKLIPDFLDRKRPGLTLLRAVFIRSSEARSPSSISSQLRTSPMTPSAGGKL